MQSWQELSNVLQCEVFLIEQAISLAESKKAALINSDADGVESVASQELALSGKIKEEDQHLVQVMAVLAETYDITSLPNLVASSWCPSQLGLLSLYGQLKERVVTLRALQQQNQPLLSQALNFVDFSVKAMLGTKSDPAYGANGLRGQAVNHRRLDFKA